MSNKIIILWGTVIFLLCTTVLVFGKYYNSKYEYIEADEMVKIYIKEYFKEKDVKLSFKEEIKVTSELLNKTIKIKEIDCTYEAIVKNYFVFKTYKINDNCVNEILE